MKMKISIITPSLNCGKSIDRAIRSVLVQNYLNYEHIIVDAGSTDETLNILRQYPHLKWISEPDRGQAHAMNKGFALATGDVIGYLNADDHYSEGAFSEVVPHFNRGDKMVMGKVLVRSQKADGLREWVCDAKTDFLSMLRHWEDNAFCVNPVGYFYLREIQDAVPFLEETGSKHDLEFLIEVSRLFPIKKINTILGTFNHNLDTQTGREQLLPSYWLPANFSFVDRLATHLTELERKKFCLDRDRGYQLRRQWTAKEAFAAGMDRELIEKGEVFFLPEDEQECYQSSCGFVEHDRIGTKLDWIIPVLTMGKVGSKSILFSLKSLPKNVLPAEVYHVHQMPVTMTRPTAFPDGSHVPVGFALKKVFDTVGKNMRWKFITGVRDPISAALSEFFENHWNEKLDIEYILTYLTKAISTDYFLNYFSEYFYSSIGVNVYHYKFDFKKNYTIIVDNNISVLLYRMEDLSNIFCTAIEEYLGICDLKLLSVNIGAKKPYRKVYQIVREQIRFEKSFLEKVYSSKYVKHFYTDREIEGFINQWLVEPATDCLPQEDCYGLIYDIGLHIGQDTEFYLKKGFRVLAVDANPIMVENAAKKFADFLASGQLILLNVGIVESATEEYLTFFVNDRCSEWSSFIPGIAGRDGGPIRGVQVHCTTIENLVKEYGEPYYVKIDIEGYDHIALSSMKNSGARPRFVSVENGNMGMVDVLLEMGFNSFKYVQQNNMPGITLPFPPLEGVYIEHTFPFGASGPFGEETPGAWKCAGEIRKEIAKVWDPDGHSKNPAHRDESHGWFDLHAKRS
jgi:FkbM family methyltransferase